MPDPQTPRDEIRRNLTQTIIGRPLIDKLNASTDPNAVFDVIIDPNLDFSGGRAQVSERIQTLIRESLAPSDPDPRIRFDIAHPYVFARLTARAIREIARRDLHREGSIAPAPGKQRLTGAERAIYRIWEDMEVRAFLTSSIATVKADAAQTAFSADGKDIVWAIIDSGIDQTHEHFAPFCNLALVPPLAHKDFTPGGDSPLTDAFGHGSHVAGIVAGMMDEAKSPQAIIRTRDHESGEITSAVRPLGRTVRGMAPRCKLISLKVLDDDGAGKASGVIEALAAVQTWNDFGRRIVVHGVNLSLGYPFMPEWFACGQSPLCVEVNRLVKSGVVVVVAAGNSGYGSIGATSGLIHEAGLPQTINDPGNAEYAITVGSTHRDMPHVYGVSYFSSKGPTGDGRLKPDLVAPGERILSCAAGNTKESAADGLPAAEKDKPFQYVEDSGTSMAAPHVSGVIAAFLSIRREYIGQPEEVKKLFMENATDLNRDRTFQGRGLVDLMRAIQAV
ncbi:MAG TPA: S8 family peptidase [Bryobacteraceae bacterium]|nr:S8 family peptidase [Bryobacteraceae bacterium]